MNKISSINKKSVVKIFTKMSFGFLMGLCIPALGVEIQVTAKDAAKAIENDSKQRELDRADTTRRQQATDCKDINDKIREAQSKLTQICADSALGADECTTESLNCADTMSEDSYDSLGTIGQALGVSSQNVMGIKAIGQVFGADDSKALNDLGEKCPQIGGDAFDDKMDTMKDKLEEIKKQIADLNDERAELKSSYDEKNKKIEEKLAEERQAYSEKKKQIAEDTQQKTNDFMRTQQEAKEKLKSEATAILKLRGEINASQKQYALELLAMNENSGVRGCRKAYDDARKSYNSGGSSSHMSSALTKKKDLIAIYNDCMNNFYIHRKASIERQRQLETEKNNEIANHKSTMDEVQNTLNLADTQLKEMKASATTQEKEALQAVIDLAQRGQQELKAANDEMMTKLNTIAVKEQNLKKSLNTQSNSLITKNSKKARSLSKSISSQMETIASLESERESLTDETGSLYCKQAKKSGKGGSRSHSQTK